MKRSRTRMTPQTQLKRARVRGLDSIRFICALWVFFGHGAAPPLANPFPPDSPAHFAFRGFYGNIWSGPAAVIVFFVISGFCIHYPCLSTDRHPLLKEFYARRFLRLLPPVILAIPLSGLMGLHLSLLQDSVLWSLFAEMIYYICYPAFRHAQLRMGSWRGLVILSFAVAWVVAASNPSAGNYPSYGAGLNWLLGLPCWLMGCMIAESTHLTATRDVSTVSIWSWRAVIFSAAFVCCVLRFHSSDWLSVDTEFFCRAGRLLAPTRDCLPSAHRSAPCVGMGRTLELFALSFSSLRRRFV